MAIALDYTSRIDPAALKAAGVTTVCRYLSWLYRYGGKTNTAVNPKIVQKAEYDELRAAGIQVVLNWEYDPHDYRGGAMAGADHSREAILQAQALGYPAGSVIIGSADADVTRAEWLGTGRPYYTAFSTNLRISGYRPGIYGPYDVLTWARDDDVAEVFWQAGMSTAWSQTRNKDPWPGAHLRQRGAKTVGGVSGDWNDILRPWEAAMAQLDYGQQGPPTGDKYATDLSRATTGQGVFLADLAGQEMQGHSLYNGVGKSFRTLQLERIEADLADLKAAVAALATGGVDAAALANDVATKIGAAIADAFAAIANKPADE